MDFLEESQASFLDTLGYGCRTTATSIRQSRHARKKFLKA
jgi:hypothetical protein